MKKVKAKWFEGESVLNLKFKNINNKIEAVKYAHEKENHQIEWIIGILAFIFISLGIFKAKPIHLFYIRNFSISLSFLMFAALIFLIIIYVMMFHYQKKNLIKLYLEKDRKSKK